MSFRISINDYDTKQREKISKDLTVYIPETKYAPPKKIELYGIDQETDDGILIPFDYYNDYFRNGKKEGKYPPMSTHFTGSLNKIQTEKEEEALYFLLNYYSLMICLATGMGKTIFAIYLACKLKLKTIVQYHRVNIADQWESSILKVCHNAKIQKITSKSKIDPTADFYLINVDTANKRKRKEFSHIGIVICDESHCMVTENRISSLYLYEPKYMIALTATPEQCKDMGILLTTFFGPFVIHVPMYRMFNVYILKTAFNPKSKCNERTGALDWNDMIEQQCNDKGRNKQIIQCCKYFANRNILVLCKRKNQTEELFKTFKLNNKEVEMYTGSQKEFNEECRVLFSTYSKSGVGFDFPKLDMLIIASDVDEGIQQYIGRIFRTRDTIPIIIDFKDKVYKNHSLNKHLNNRIEVYETSGGIVKNFEYNFK